jgi:putative SOS response-associated peptidase YedK
VVAQLHSRMPVILERSWENTWLDKETADNRQALEVLGHNPDVDLEAYPVSRRVNAARDDDPALIERV